MQHGDDADRKIARDPATDLEKSERRACRQLRVPLRQLHHVLDASTHRVHSPDMAFETMRCVHVSQGRIFPAGHEHRQVLLRGRHQPRILGIDLVLAF